MACARCVEKERRSRSEPLRNGDARWVDGHRYEGGVGAAEEYLLERRLARGVLQSEGALL